MVKWAILSLLSYTAAHYIVPLPTAETPVADTLEDPPTSVVLRFPRSAGLSRRRRPPGLSPPPSQEFTPEKIALYRSLGLSLPGSPGDPSKPQRLQKRSQLPGGSAKRRRRKTKKRRKNRRNRKGRKGRKNKKRRNRRGKKKNKKRNKKRKSDINDSAWRQKQYHQYVVNIPKGLGEDSMQEQLKRKMAAEYWSRKTRATDNNWIGGMPPGGKTKVEYLQDFKTFAKAADNYKRGLISPKAMVKCLVYDDVTGRCLSHGRAEPDESSRARSSRTGSARTERAPLSLEFLEDSLSLYEDEPCRLFDEVTGRCITGLKIGCFGGTGEGEGAFGC